MVSIGWRMSERSFRSDHGSFPVYAVFQLSRLKKNNMSERSDASLHLLQALAVNGGHSLSEQDGKLLQMQVGK